MARLAAYAACLAALLLAVDSAVLASIFFSDVDNISYLVSYIA